MWNDYRLNLIFIKELKKNLFFFEIFLNIIFLKKVKFNQ
jgi:hypothetical protein